MSEETETKIKKNPLYKKWWFWLCSVLIVLMLGFTSIMMFAFSVVASEIAIVAKQIQNVSEDTTLYTSAGGSIAILQIEHFNDLEEENIDEILNVIKDNKDSAFSECSKFIILAYVDSENQDNPMLIITEYDMPDFTVSKQISYIDFDVYSDAMEGYTTLFNSIF